MIVVVMGVCGCGKTTVGEALAAAFGWPFFDADNFHPAANVAKMAAGIPLTDDDRWPWLDRLAAEMGALERRGGNAVLACSALKQAYRDRLAAAGKLRFVHLRGDRATLAARIAARRDHYMPPTLLDSQLATLEPPVGAIDVDITLPVAAQVEFIRRRLAPDSPSDGR
ncbi:MAG: gluconokinase [Betaproteobacteria bacterium]|nr:gluconokinase [Betaproteobacteria bacterium]